MRARMALKYAGIQVETREIALRDKPAHMLQVSPKGTVPVLILENGTVLEQSLDIMQWALQQRDDAAWLDADRQQMDDLIAENDGAFKQALDKYKYAIHFPEQPAETYRAQGEQFLQKLELMLQMTPFLFGTEVRLADIAIFPFVRQFAAVDADWFAQASYPQLQAWLHGLVESALFISIMEKQPTYVA